MVVALTPAHATAINVVSRQFVDASFPAAFNPLAVTDGFLGELQEITVDDPFSLRER